jgi:hypothetical protein
VVVLGVPPCGVGVVPKEEAAGGVVVLLGVPKLEALGVLPESEEELLLLAPPVGKSCACRHSAPPHAQRASPSVKRCLSPGIFLKVRTPAAGVHGV